LYSQVLPQFLYVSLFHVTLLYAVDLPVDLLRIEEVRMHDYY